MWPPEPEVIIPPELQQMASKFQRQVRNSRPWRDRIKCHQVIATMSDNRKWQYRRFARQSCNFWQSIVVAIIWLIFCQAGHHQKSRIWRWSFDAICQCQSSTDVIISGFGGHIDISGCRSLLHLLAETIFHLYVVWYPRFVVGILTVLFTVFDCLSLLKSLT